MTDQSIRVRALYGAADNVKSYHRFFIDTNFENAIPDDPSERRFFIIKCSSEKKGDPEYFVRLVEAIKSSLGVRAFYDLLKTRSCKEFYIGKDIPVGDFARELKDHNRPFAERFVQALVEDQPVDSAYYSGTADDLTRFYKRWNEGGDEKTKGSVTRMLALKSIEGITKRKPIDKATEKQFTQYAFDLVRLRTYFGLDVSIANAREETRVANAVSAAREKGVDSMIHLVSPSKVADTQNELKIDVDSDIDFAFEQMEYLGGPSPKQQRT